MENTVNLKSSIAWSDFKLNSDGMVPVIAQDYQTNEVLMLAYMNEEAFNQTVKTGRMTYYSRSRQKLWLKGETSGHFQYVKSLTIDCDLDTLLAKVDQVGAAQEIQLVSSSLLLEVIIMRRVRYRCSNMFTRQLLTEKIIQRRGLIQIISLNRDRIRS